MLFILAAILATGTGWLYLRSVSAQGFPVLMYHKVSPEHADDLTVTVSQLEAHLQYLHTNGYQVLPLQRLLTLVSGGEALPARSVFLTFDDGYLNNLQYAYPVLEKYQAHATIFLPTHYIGKTSSWDQQAEDLLNISQLQSLNPALVSFGLHSHVHRSYQAMTIEEITSDLQQNISYLTENGIPFVQAFAYPYGKRPKNKAILKLMKDQMKSAGIVAAFRIGNRLNRSISDAYELQRLDIRGTDTPEDFRKKLTGRAKMFF